MPRVGDYYVTEGMPSYLDYSEHLPALIEECVDSAEDRDRPAYVWQLVKVVPASVSNDLHRETEGDYARQQEKEEVCCGA